MAYGSEGPESRKAAEAQVDATLSDGAPFARAQFERARGDDLAPYGEEEDVVTQVIDAEIVEPKWIVQITPLDRRMMATTELLNESLRGALVRPDTLVWRGGMDDWQPLDSVDALASLRRQIPTLLPRANAATRVNPAARASMSVSRRAPPSTPSARVVSKLLAVNGRVSGGVLASIAIVLSTAALTISALAVFGVFDSGPSAPGSESSVSASAE
jgi:hypothetical protein